MIPATTVDHELARLLADCALSGSSGIVTAVRGKLKRLFCVKEGHLAFAASNLIEDQFSEALVRDGIVSVGALAGANEESSRSGTKLAPLLVAEGVVTEGALRAAFETHVRELLFSTLAWPEGETKFERGLPDLERELVAKLPCATLLLEFAARCSRTLDQIRSRTDSPTARLVVRTDRGELLRHAELGPEVHHLLAGCNGEAPLEELVASSPVDAESTWRAIYALWLLGIIEPQTRAAPDQESVTTRSELLAELQRAENADYYGVLDVAPLASRERIREAYYVRARRFHPDHFRTGPMEDVSERIESYFSTVTEAYNTLSDPALRAEYDAQRAADEQTRPEQDTTFLARENFRRAKALIARKRFSDAATSLENAIALDGRNAEYRLELGRLLAANPRLRARAEEQLIEANRCDPSLVEGYLALGELYVKMNRRDDAIRLFREALRWEPGHLEATERLRELGLR